jgi:hypothetical protein
MRAFMMSRSPRTPADLARRSASRLGERSGSAIDPAGGQASAFDRRTYRMPREEARRTAREWFDRYPKAAYMTRVESWRVLDNGLIEFTMRRLPSAD